MWVLDVLRLSVSVSVTASMCKWASQSVGGIVSVLASFIVAATTATQMATPVVCCALLDVLVQSIG